jgi:hypothetical protein
MRLARASVHPNVDSLKPPYSTVRPLDAVALAHLKGILDQWGGVFKKRNGHLVDPAALHVPAEFLEPFVA